MTCSSRSSYDLKVEACLPMANVNSARDAASTVASIALPFSSFVVGV